MLTPLVNPTGLSTRLSEMTDGDPKPRGEGFEAVFQGMEKGEDQPESQPEAKTVGRPQGAEGADEKEPVAASKQAGKEQASASDPLPETDGQDDDAVRFDAVADTEVTPSNLRKATGETLSETRVDTDKRVSDLSLQRPERDTESLEQRAEKISRADGDSPTGRESSIVAPMAMSERPTAEAPKTSAAILAAPAREATLTGTEQSQTRTPIETTDAPVRAKEIHSSGRETPRADTPAYAGARVPTPETILPLQARQVPDQDAQRTRLQNPGNEASPAPLLRSASTDAPRMDFGNASLTEQRRPLVGRNAVSPQIAAQSNTNRTVSINDAPADRVAPSIRGADARSMPAPSIPMTAALASQETRTQSRGADTSPTDAMRMTTEPRLGSPANSETPIPPAQVSERAKTAIPSTDMPVQISTRKPGSARLASAPAPASKDGPPLERMPQSGGRMPDFVDAAATASRLEVKAPVTAARADSLKQTNSALEGPNGKTAIASVAEKPSGRNAAAPEATIVRHAAASNRAPEAPFEMQSPRPQVAQTVAGVKPEANRLEDARASAAGTSLEVPWTGPSRRDPGDRPSDFRKLSRSDESETVLAPQRPGPVAANLSTPRVESEDRSRDMDRQVQDDPRSAIRFETGTKDRADMRQPQPISTPVNPGPTPVAVPMAVVNTADAESVSPELDKVDIAHQQSEARVAQSSVAASNSAHRTEIAQALLRQITSGLAQAQDGRVEIRLEPEELGRLRMQIVPVDQGVTVHVSADRQETLDLLRRNIEQLARELRELGYQQTSFSFDGQGNGGQQSFDEQAGHAPRTADRTEPHTETANPARNIAPQDGLDLRL